MLIQNLSSAVLFFIFGANSIFMGGVQNEAVLATHTISLENRYPDRYVNSVFKDNILLNLAYMRGEVKKVSDINWENIRKPFYYSFQLESGETFAYHEDVYPEYQEKVTRTTNTHFNIQDGFKSDGYLAGDGVCHLASLIYWAAKDALLLSNAPTNHDFAPIPEVPKEFGVSIYYNPGSASANAVQNLYVTNNFESPVTFEFKYDGQNLTVSVKSEKVQMILPV